MLKASLRLSIMRLWKAASSVAPSFENSYPCRIFLTARSIRFLSMMSPMLFEVDGKRDDLHRASSVSIIEALAGHLGHIELYLLVQAVHGVVPAPELTCEVEVR